MLKEKAYSFYNIVAFPVFFWFSLYRHQKVLAQICPENGPEKNKTFNNFVTEWCSYSTGNMECISERLKQFVNVRIYII